MDEDIVQIADDLIPAANGKIVLKKNGETPDIIAEVLSAFKDSREQLKNFAPHLKAATLRQTLHNVWDFWKHHVTYKVDPQNKQLVQEPAAFWAAPRQGDCKSFSVAVMSTLYSLGIKAAFRFASYNGNKKFPTHVYVVVLDGGKTIPVDCVWKEFGTQKPFTKNWDYNMSTAIYRVSGLPGNDPEQVGKFSFGKLFKKLANPLNSLKLLAAPALLAKKLRKKKKPGTAKPGIVRPMQTKGIVRRPGIKRKRKGPHNKMGRGRLHMPLNNHRITGDVADILLDKQYLEMQQIQHAKINGIGTDEDTAFETQIVAHHNAVAAIMGWPEKNFYATGEHLAPEERNEVGFLGLSKKEKVKKLEKAKKDNTAGKAVSKKMAKRLKKVGITATKIKADLLKRIGKGILKVLTTPARLALKAVLPKSGPFFLYLFITDAKIIARLPEAVKIKRDKALHYKSVIVDKLQMNESNFTKSIRNGIMNEFGKTPETVLAEWMKTANFSIGIVTEVIGIAAKGLKLLLGKAAANLQEDVTNNAPAPEDWGILSAEQQQTMSEAVQQQPAAQQPLSTEQLYNTAQRVYNTDQQPTDGATWANRGSNADDATGDTSLNDITTGGGVTVKAKRGIEPIEEEHADTGGNGLMYAGIAAAGLLLLAGKKGKK